MTKRLATIAAAVLAAHALLLWALTHGLLQKPVEIMVPAEMIAQMQEPASPRQAPPAPQPTTPPKTAAAPSTPRPTPVPMPQPETRPSPTPAPAPAAPAPQATASAASPTAPTTSTTPSTPATSSNATSAAASALVQLPSSSADYLQNPKPPYPPLSLRMGESGRAVHRVWIGPDGRPQKAELIKSSGYPRLDKASYDAVMTWRYVPGKRGGIPELMAFDVPISWELPN